MASKPSDIVSWKNNAILLSAGMSTGVISAMANQPIDTAKSLIQADPNRFQGTWGTLKKVFQSQGVKGWYAGSGPRVARLTIGQGIIFSCQESISDHLHGRFA